MGDTTISFAGEGIRGSVRLIERLALASGLVLFGLILLKFTGAGEIALFGVNISSRFSIPAMLLISAAHVWLGFHLIYDLANGWRVMPFEQRMRLFDEVTNKDAFFLKGASRYSIDASGRLLILEVPRSEPMGWLHTAYFLACIIACTDFSAVGGAILTALIGLVIATFNWFAASSWLVALCDFGRSAQSRYFAPNLRPQARYFSALSGDTTFSRPVGPIAFACRQALSAFLTLLPVLFVVLVVFVLVSGALWLFSPA